MIGIESLALHEVVRGALTHVKVLLAVICSIVDSARAEEV
jgi:hypothetical protein